MARAVFDSEGFLAAARAIAAERGPAAVTIGLVAQRLGAPLGSFYHRFASRDALLGQLWLDGVLRFQAGFVEAVAAGDGLRAALHTPAWVRANPQDARLLMLYRRHDFVHGPWPDALQRGVQDQAQRFLDTLTAFAGQAFGTTDRADVARALFVLWDAPHAAVKPYIERREPPPPLVDDLVIQTYRAIVGDGAPGGG